MNQDAIDRVIAHLYRAINLHAVAGDPDEIKRIRVQIAELETKKQQLRLKSKEGQ